MLEITPEKAFAEISSGQSIGIDVRESDEWSASRAPKVSWNPKSAFNLSAMPKNQRVILIYADLEIAQVNWQQNLLIKIRIFPTWRAG